MRLQYRQTVRLPGRFLERAFVLPHNKLLEASMFLSQLICMVHRSIKSFLLS